MLNPAVTWTVDLVSRPPDETLSRQPRPGNEAVEIAVTMFISSFVRVDVVMSMAQFCVSVKTQNGAAPQIV
jgi:hypothetical protein